MIVSSSKINMSSSHVYAVHTATVDHTAMTTAGGSNKAWQSYSQYESDYVESSKNALLSSGETATYSWQELNEQGTAFSISSSADISAQNSNISLRSSMVLRLLEIFLGNRRDLLEKLRKQMGISDDAVIPGSQTSTWHSTSTHYSEVMETEAISFETKGTAITSDGRSLSFNMEIEMSQSFFQQTNYTIEQSGDMLTDPLVVWLNDSPDAIADQRFSFDLDQDGKEENIPQLDASKGFLAYDKNSDGIINDGSELFGTKSGDGFRDLAAYDDDGNGFIDEADTIYKKLRVWTKDSEGKDTLLDLKEADIGAIYLGHLATSLNIRDSDDGQIQAVVRSNGIYLHEDGTTDMIQQIDLATQANN